MKRKGSIKEVARIVNERDELLARGKELVLLAAVAFPSEFVFLIGDRDLHTCVADVEGLATHQRFLLERIEVGRSVRSVYQDEPRQS